MAVFCFLCCSFWKRLNQFLASLSTLRMLSLERQNECAFILLSERHDRPNLSAVTAHVNSVELSPSEFQTSAERHVVSAIHLVTAAVT